MRLVLAGAIALAVCAASHAQPPDPDLDLIPTAGAPPPEPEMHHGNRRLYVENAVTAVGNRQDFSAPAPPNRSFDWQDRILVDIRSELAIGEQVRLFYSGRLNLRAENDLDFPDHKDVVNDLREAYLSWQADDGVFFDLGRINLKNGVALGFNPTDFFRGRAVVEPLSADPTALREDRLGTAMIRGQMVVDGASLTAALAPRLTDPTAIAAPSQVSSFDPLFDHTNAETRLLIKAGIALTDDLTPELLAFHDGHRTAWGANLTSVVDANTIVYGEWSGGRRGDIISEALDFGVRTGSLPSQIVAADPHSAQHFANALSLGASYTTADKVTFNAEYHLFQPGFSQQDWHNWFAAKPAIGAAALWYLRGYANDQQDPISRHSVFLRADWTDAMIRNLELTGFVNIDLYDGSSLCQITADYYLSDHWTIGALASANIGGNRTDFGSLPQATNTLFKVRYYF